MLDRLGLILIVSGFLLLANPNFLSPDHVDQLVKQTLTNWPIFLIVIGFILAMPKKRKKSRR